MHNKNWDFQNHTKSKVAKKWGRGQIGKEQDILKEQCIENYIVCGKTEEQRTNKVTNLQQKDKT